MHTNVTHVAYRHTGYFTPIINDYIDGNTNLLPFFEYPATHAGIEQALLKRKNFATNRILLHQHLQQQYAGINTSQKVKDNINSLLNNNTFTITTAHQPNLFTGYLYFIFKILHAVKLAAELKTKHPQQNFVPVYWMGSEDADLDELGKVNLFGEKIAWQTKQKGAVGRMKVDDQLLLLIEKLQGMLGIEPHGIALIALLNKCYAKGNTIQQATFLLVNELFASYGLIVLVPDDAALKKTMQHIFKDDLLQQTASSIVEKTIHSLQKHYKVQANPRLINLFYLKNDIRNRIELNGDVYKVVDTGIHFTKAELLFELEQHPERFSPNVILRGLYQELLLPNIIFIGGGGEIAYWLELRHLFMHYKIPMPVLMLRNSLWLLEEKWIQKITKLGFEPHDFFKPSNLLLNELVKRDATVQVHLTNELRDNDAFYKHLQNIAANIDVTLVQHTAALHKKTVKQLTALEKKLLRAAKRKFGEQQQQINKIKQQYFPGDGLQERTENFMPYYAKYGTAFFDTVYNSITPMSKEFIIAAL
jgi:bacillithiol synthase